MRALVILLSISALAACGGNKEKDKAPILPPEKVNTDTNVCPVIASGIYQEFTKEGKPGNVIQFLKITKLENGNYMMQLDPKEDGLEVNGQIKRNEAKGTEGNAGCVLVNGEKVIKYSFGGKIVMNGTIAPNADGSLTVTNVDKNGVTSAFRTQKIADAADPKDTTPKEPVGPNPAQKCKNFVGKYVPVTEGTEVKSLSFAQTGEYQTIVITPKVGKKMSFSTEPVEEESEDGDGQLAFCAKDTYINVLMITKNADGTKQTLTYAFTIPLDAPDTVVLTIEDEDKNAVIQDGKPVGPFTFKKAN